MESKTKHRILGILVIAGLLVIALPFLQTSNELSTPEVQIKSPPFPAPAASSNTLPVASTPATISDAPTASSPAPVTDVPDDTIHDQHQADKPTLAPPIVTTPPTPIKPTSPENAPASDAEETNKISTTTVPKPEFDIGPSADEQAIPDSSQTAAPSAPEAMMNVPETKVNEVTTETHPPVVKMTKAKHAHVVATRAQKSGLAARRARTVSYVRMPLDDDGLVKLANASWVIEMGSYKNKATALRAVNELRAKGYRAFIQETSAGNGRQTQVFVGPESKQVHARRLADELEKTMHMHGIVISYQPLAT